MKWNQDNPYFPAGDAGHSRRGVILHPTDYSEAARRAFELACRLAGNCGSLLIVMHVAEPVRISSFGMAPTPPLPTGYRGAWESRLQLLRPADANVRVEHRLEEGDVAAAILRVAREVPCDLIVMSSRERTWFWRLLTSSVSEEINRKAPCRVLAVRPPSSGAGLSSDFLPDEASAVTGSLAAVDGIANKEAQSLAHALPASRRIRTAPAGVRSW